MNQSDQTDQWPIFCQRCRAKLTPGEGNFYVVRIEAFADPTPPSFSREDLQCDVRAEIERLIAEMSELSAREAMDQVCRRLTVYLCGRCYADWIEDPTG
jgi:hypothetical protein